MTDTSAAAMPPLTIAILSSQCLVRLGLKNILESSTIAQMSCFHPRTNYLICFTPTADQTCSS